MIRSSPATSRRRIFRTTSTGSSASSCSTRACVPRCCATSNLRRPRTPPRRAGKSDLGQDMETLLILLLMPMPLLVANVADPAPSVWKGRQEIRNLDCSRISQERAHELYPEKVPETAPRSGNLSRIDALVCRQRLMRPGERSPRDEVILSSLGQIVGEITGVAGALGSNDTVWHVDAFYPDARVASKISVAARTSLAESRHQVSDAVPLLA